MPSLRFALRAMLRTPLVTAVAAVSLALGIGANTAIFSIYDQLLLRPLPVPEPERLVNLGNPGPKPGSQSCGMAGDCDVVFSYPMFRDLEQQQDGFTGLAAHVGFGANLAPSGQVPISGMGMLVSGSYFPTLGLAPALGRLFTPDDDRTIGANYLVVLSHAYWVEHLGSDPSVVGQTLVVNGHSLRIIGVAPRGFDGTTAGAHPLVFVPLTMRAQMLPGWTGFEDRRSYWAYLFGRLRPGVSIEQAASRLNVQYHAIINDIEAPLQKGMSDQTLARFRSKALTLEDGHRGQSSLHSQTRQPLLFLLAITGLVVLIACANIANLLLARGAQRSGEMAVRLALGAPRRRLLVQLLTESCLLALLGGVASLLVAEWTLSGIRALLPADNGMDLHFGLDPRVLLFAALLSIVTGLVFGMFPALHSTRPDLIASIRSDASHLLGARAANTFRTALVVGQIGLSMSLLILAGLLVRSLVNASRADLGLNADRIVTFSVSPELNGYDRVKSALLFDRLHDELAAIPGVSGVTASTVPILSGDNWGSDVSVEGFKRGPDTDANARYNEVGPGYFRVMDIPMLAGREFTLADQPEAAKVAIVNEAFVRKFGLGKDVIGKHMSTGRDSSLDREIVGLVKDAKYSQVTAPVPPLFFLPYRADTSVGSVNYYVRTAIDPAGVLSAIRPIVAKLDPSLPLEDLKTLPEQITENLIMERVIGTLSAAFALLATGLAAMGIYGVLAYMVALRTREIGVRLALGADDRSVRRMILGQVARMTLLGAVMGVGAALALGRVIRSQLFGLTATDPLIFALAVMALAVVALGAGYLPALRASRVHPMQALRYE